MTKQKSLKCGINPESNVYLVYFGGCEKPLSLKESYRCTGCGVRFHKDCILKHFELEKDHDWGRQDERQKLLDKVKNMNVAIGGVAIIKNLIWELEGSKYEKTN